MIEDLTQEDWQTIILAISVASQGAPLPARQEACQLIMKVAKAMGMDATLLEDLMAAEGLTAQIYDVPKAKGSA